MTDHSSPAVGRAAIDAYLDSVELALIATDAPRIDRLQVLQDLESQIADMLAREPMPHTEESVRTVLDKLEPPSHFAVTYGNGRETPQPTPDKFARLPRPGWSTIAAVGCAIFPLGGMLSLFAHDFMHMRVLADLLALLTLLSFMFTPFALWKAYKQLRAQPGTSGRDLVLNSTIAYGVFAPILSMLYVAARFGAYAIFPLGVAALLYVQYTLLRRLWRYMSDALPPQPASAPTSNTNGNGASAPITTGTPMPAM